MMKLGNEYGQYYKSSSEHNMKSPIPMKLKIALSVFVACIAFTVSKFNSAGFFGDKQDVQVSATNDKHIKTTEKTTQDVVVSKEQTQIEQLKIELEALKIRQDLEHYKRLNELKQIYLPKDYEIIANEPALQVRAVISNKRHCSAYNSHGDLMTLSQNDCTYYLEETGRVHKPQSQFQQIQLVEKTQ